MNNTEELLANWIRPGGTVNERLISGSGNADPTRNSSSKQPLQMFANDDVDIDEQILRLSSVPETYGRIAAKQTLGVLDEMERNAKGQALESKQREARLTELTFQLRKIQGESEMLRERESHLVDENNSLKRQLVSLERQLRDGYPKQTARLLEENGLLREKLSKYKNLYEKGLKQESNAELIISNKGADRSATMEELYFKIEEMFRRPSSIQKPSPPPLPQENSIEVERSNHNEGRKSEADFKQLFTDILHRMEVTDSNKKENHEEKKNVDTEKVALEQLIKRLIQEEITGLKKNNRIRPRSAPTTTSKIIETEEEFEDAVEEDKSHKISGEEHRMNSLNQQLLEAVLKALQENRELNAQVLTHLKNPGNEQIQLEIGKNTSFFEPQPQCGQCSEVDENQQKNKSVGKDKVEPENTLNLMGEYKWTI